MKIYTNLKDAINDGQGRAPCGIGYKQDAGWFVYDLAEGMLVDNAVPDFVCVKNGVQPVPLSDTAEQSLQSLYISQLN